MILTLNKKPAHTEMIGKAAEGPAPAPKPDTPPDDPEARVEAARQAAIAHHEKQLRDAIAALLGLAGVPHITQRLIAELEDLRILAAHNRRREAREGGLA